jgi:hypothetical protein
MLPRIDCTDVLAIVLKPVLAVAESLVVAAASDFVVVVVAADVVVVVVVADIVVVVEGVAAESVSVVAVVVAVAAVDGSDFYSTAAAAAVEPGDSAEADGNTVSSVPRALFVASMVFVVAAALS